MRPHSLPSLLGLAAIAAAALVVALALGVASNVPAAQAASHDDDTLINVTTADQFAVIQIRFGRRWGDRSR